ncbi:MAG: hypothetical protein KDA93_14505 [Planctomycetaceae bacterium]|nr:hypothetical protein [Planctomycetaceae bacterium]
MATQHQVDSFYRFASEQIRESESDLSMAELFDLWQLQSPDESELAESVSAVKAALADMEQGDTGRPLHEFFSELRHRHGMRPEE